MYTNTQKHADAVTQSIHEAVLCFQFTVYIHTLLRHVNGNGLVPQVLSCFWLLSLKK